jgi:hypothetical protein
MKVVNFGLFCQHLGDIIDRHLEDEESDSVPSGRTYSTETQGTG